MTKQALLLRLAQVVSLEQREQLRQTWNRNVSSPAAFLPHERVGKVSIEEAEANNKDLGNFSTGFVRRCLAQFATTQGKVRREIERKKIIAVGYGRGYDSPWIYEAGLAGLATWWIDVSDKALELAWPDIEAQVYASEARGVSCPSPGVRLGEIHTVLSDPSSIGLEDLSTISAWYFGRTLGCLYKWSAPLVLQEVGQTLSEDVDPLKENQIIIVQGLQDNNQGYVSCTSTLHRRTMIQRNIRKGAGRSVEIALEDTHPYYDKIVTAMCFKAI